jgi:3-mercaptopyruvate sulfurtransferase SseA
MVRFAFMIVLVLVCSCVKERRGVLDQQSYSNITARELMERIERGKEFVLVDTRTVSEYAKGHIEGAILIPHAEIEARHKEISRRFG